MLQAIGVARVNVVGFDQERAKLGPAPFIAAGRQRAQGVAMIALSPRDDVPAPSLALFDEILTGHLERRLDRLGPAAHQVDMVYSSRRILDQAVGQLLGNIRGEEPGMGIGQRVELLVKCCKNIRVAVAETG
jgi:hypothetical protein